MINCSLLINTKNEEMDLPDCLLSVKWSNDIVVYDSYSSDKTCEIAKEFGARIFQRPNQDKSLLFGGDEAIHRNWGLRNIKFKNQWVLLLDADERIDKNFFKKFCEIDKSFLNKYSGFSIERRDHFMDKHLKHAQSLKMYIRLIRPEYFSYQRKINASLQSKGKLGTFKSHINHYPFSKGIKFWIDKHNKYSDFEAETILSERINFFACILKVFLNLNDNLKLRFYMKIIYYYLWGRPFARFLFFYFLKKGFLDGRAGLNYSLLMGIYEYFISIKISEKIGY